MSLFFKENFTLEKGRRAWLYLFIIFFCHIFNSYRGEGGMGFFFSLFVIFCIVC
jgi:hypothetical protein